MIAMSSAGWAGIVVVIVLAVFAFGLARANRRTR
jgi:hypothetical protein